MTKPDLSAIDQPWPSSGLERVEACPYCHSQNRSVAYLDVQDWSFYGAPGKWTYWDCHDCQALYLDPRPTRGSIGAAYKTYYTHTTQAQASILQLLKERIRNECWSHLLNADIGPRLYLPKGLAWLLMPLKSRLVESFGLRELASLPKGRLVDVGCGNGNTLSLATKLCWQAMGLEIDPAAVRAARTQGLDVFEGTYERLAEYGQVFDCIVCTHVLEHVHNPQDMLIKLERALKPGGMLLLSLPNATSALRYHFGENWRGLEAPRHLSIPSMHRLKAKLEEMGFSVTQRQLNVFATAAESSRIQRRATELNAYDKTVEKTLVADKVRVTDQEHDFVQFVCLKNKDETQRLASETSTVSPDY